MQKCDALVIGGGPAGSSAARGLRRAGLDVLVLDKSPFPRDKTCAGWITPPVLDILEITPDEYARGRVMQPIRGFDIGRMGGRTFHAEYDGIVSYGIRRCEFDQYLLQRSGARCELGTPLRTLERVGDRWCVNGEFEAPFLIGAGGHFCPVARRLGPKDADDGHVVAAQEIEFELTSAQRSETRVRGAVPELYFCKDVLGYGWCFLKENFLNVGLGREDTQGLSGHLQRFVEWLQQHGRIPHDLPGKFHGHAYTLYGHARRTLFDNGVLLVGDAAGLAYAPSGEGIRTAVESGLMAAETAVAAAGNYRRERLAAYRAALIERYGELTPRGWYARIPLRWKLALAARLMSTRWFAQRVVLEKWFLHSAPAKSSVAP